MELRAVAFWRLFRRIHDKLEGGDSDRAAMEELLDELQRIDARLYYHLGHHDEGQDLLISAEGHYELGPLVESIVRSGPELPGWDYVPLVDSSVLFEQRNTELFPTDENGDVLWQMALGRDLLWRARDIELAFVFDADDRAQAFAAAVREPTKVSPYEGGWQVIVTLALVPTHAAITMHEERLAALAHRYNGRADGWGCLHQSFDD